MAAHCLLGGSLAGQRMVSPASCSGFARGQKLFVPLPAALSQRGQRLIPLAQAAQAERLRLNNLSPPKGSRPQEKRKGRGYGAGQGGSCGFGMRGQKSRSGSGTRPGFEGGQTSLYRRLPKLKGIAGGMKKGQINYNVINLNDLVDKFQDGDEVSLDTLQAKRIFKLTGRDAKLPLKVLAEGDLPAKVTIKAASFSTAAKEKIEAAGGQAVTVELKPKWTRKLHKERVAAGLPTNNKARAAAKAGK